MKTRKKFIIKAIFFILVNSYAISHATEFRNLDQAGKFLEKISQTKVRPYSTRDFGREQFKEARSVIVPKANAERVLQRARESIPSGFVVFIGTTRNLAQPQLKGVELVIGKGNSQFEILRIAASNAINYDKGTEALITVLKKWDKLYGIDIWQAETDTIQLRFKSLPKNLSKFANEIYQFCPDIVDQGVGSTKKLESFIRKTKSLYLWWD